MILRTIKETFKAIVRYEKTLKEINESIPVPEKIKCRIMGEYSIDGLWKNYSVAIELWPEEIKGDNFKVGKTVIRKVAQELNVQQESIGCWKLWL